MTTKPDPSTTDQLRTETSNGQPSDTRQTPRFIDARRRGLLKGGIVAGGAAVLGVTAGESVSTPAPETGPGATDKAGYQLTEHVREYYAKARF